MSLLAVKPLSTRTKGEHKSGILEETKTDSRQHSDYVAIMSDAIPPGFDDSHGGSGVDVTMLPKPKKKEVIIESKMKLRPDAPAFDVSGSPHLDPYHGPLGVATRGEYVPPAKVVKQSPAPVVSRSHLRVAAPFGYPSAVGRSGGHSRMHPLAAHRSPHAGHHYTGAYHDGMLHDDFALPRARGVVSGSGGAEDGRYHDPRAMAMAAAGFPMHHRGDDEAAAAAAAAAVPYGYGSYEAYSKMGSGRPHSHGHSHKSRMAADPMMHAAAAHHTAAAAHAHAVAGAAVAATSAAKAKSGASGGGAATGGRPVIGPFQPSSRNYGVPNPEDIDPEFTNAPELQHHQRWELLESAKRWLPGEGTVCENDGYRYIIGAPIHMGMNGHIHYCYRYPLTTSKKRKGKGKKKKKKAAAASSATEQKRGGSGGLISSSSERKLDESKRSAAVSGSEQKSGDLGEEGESESDSEEEVLEPGTTPTVETVAAKVVPNTSAFAREIVFLRGLQGCENICTLYEVLESKRTLVSILELAQADVYNFFVGKGAMRHGWTLEKPAVREAFARMVVTNAVQGLKQMHDKSYLHCDLKSLNILLYIYKTDKVARKGGVYMKAKLTDFGHSSCGKIRLAEKTFKNGMARVGTAGHVAPELFAEGSRCEYKIDIWSLGIVMFSMLVPGRLLFGEYTNLADLKKAYDRLHKINPWSKESRPKWWTDFERLSPEARDLILWMTKLEAGSRPTIKQIMEHPWFIIAKGNLEPGQYRPHLKQVHKLCASSFAQE